MVADIEIAQGTPMRPITDVAQGLGLGREDLILKSDYVAKVRLDAVERSRKARQGKLVLVTGTTPTRYGEGKTLTTVGLGQALTKLGTKAIVAVREPSLGPVFGTTGSCGTSSRASEVRSTACPGRTASSSRPRARSWRSSASRMGSGTSRSASNGSSSRGIA